jgi:hypothetical protein
LLKYDSRGRRDDERMRDSGRERQTKREMGRWIYIRCEKVGMSVLSLGVSLSEFGGWVWTGGEVRRDRLCRMYIIKNVSELTVCVCVCGCV